MSLGIHTDIIECLTIMLFVGHASIVLIIGVTLGVVVIIAVTATLAITIKLKSRKHVSIGYRQFDN